MKKIDITIKNLSIGEAKDLLNNKSVRLEDDIFELSSLPIFSHLEEVSVEETISEEMSLEDKCNEVLSLINWNKENSGYKPQFKKTILNWIKFLEEIE